MKRYIRSTWSLDPSTQVITNVSDQSLSRQEVPYDFKEHFDRGAQSIQIRYENEAIFYKPEKQ